MKMKYRLKHLLLASSVVSLGLAYTVPTYAAFEWTPRKTVEEAPVEMEKAPVGDIAVENELPVIPGDNMVEEEDEGAPVEYIDEDVAVDDSVAEDLQEIIEEAEENNVITPVAEIPEEEKIDEITSEMEELVAEEAMPEKGEEVAEEVVENEEQEEPQEETAEVAEEESMEKPEGEMVAGFGNDLPLIMAIRQIIPSNVPYKFEPGIDLGTLVSWEGGASWQDTIEAIASANELGVRYEGDAVMLVKAKAAPEPMAEVASMEDTMAEMPEEMMAEKEAMEEPMDLQTENQALEASMSDGIIISPIEDDTDITAPALADVSSEPNPISILPEEGAVVSALDEPEMPPMEELESTMEDTMAEMPKEMMAEKEPMVEEVVTISEEKEIDQLVEETLADAEETAVEATMMDEPVEVSVTSEEEMKSTAEMPLPIEPTVAVEEMEMIEVPMPETNDVVEVPSQEENIAEVISDLELVKTWKVKKNSDLRKTLEQWTEEAGVDLQWNMQQDYPINYMVWVDGNLEEAVDVLMQGYINDKGLIPSATLIRSSSTGKPVLLIEPAA